MMKMDTSPEQQRRWFTANNVSLAIDASPVNPVVSDLHDSILLSDHEPLLAVVAEALKIDHDWQPSAPESDSVITHSLRLVSEEDIMLGLCLPVEFHNELNQVAERLISEVHVDAHHSSWSFEIAGLTLSVDEVIELLIPGSALLLSRDVNGLLRGRLNCDQHSLPASFLVDKRCVSIDASASWLIRDDQSAAFSESAECRITFPGAGMIDRCGLLNDRSDGVEVQAISVTEPNTDLVFDQDKKVRIDVSRSTEEPLSLYADLISLGECVGLRTVER